MTHPGRAVPRRFQSEQILQPVPVVVPVLVLRAGPPELRDGVPHLDEASVRGDEEINSVIAVPERVQGAAAVILPSVMGGPDLGVFLTDPSLARVS